MSPARVAILLGSDSDLPVMQQAADTLSSFGVGFLMTVCSAHRSPAFLRRFVASAQRKGVQVFIAGAGGAAHLAGVVASETHRPVIGVPLGSKLSGFDSLLSTVQMPKGVPVATMAIDGAANAASLAVQILALSDPDLSRRYGEARRAMTQAVLRKAQTMRGNTKQGGSP